jgi:Asp-tRNA(Asn)/Glu-tRNA(Gln) amidotransferase A subunit family amidase
MSLCWSLDKIGPICRAVDDAALVLAAINGFDLADVSSIEAPFGWDATRTPTGMRVGYIGSDFTDVLELALLGAVPGLGAATLPLALPGILAGLVLAFAKALGEFGATITFVSNIPGETRTLPTAIYTYTQVPGGDANAARLAAVAIVLSLAALVVSEFLSRRITARIGG